MSSKSTFSNSTSRSYALALYELGKDDSMIEVIEKEIKSLKELIDNSRDFNEVILSPAVSMENKKNIILLISEKNKFSQTLKKFLGFLAIKNRLFFLSQIIQSFLDLVSNTKGELKAKLISSKELSLLEKKKIQEDLSKEFKSTLNIDYKYDADLIAGLIIQVGSVMVDTSIKAKLKKLERNMVEA